MVIVVGYQVPQDLQGIDWKIVKVSDQQLYYRQSSLYVFEGVMRIETWENIQTGAKKKLERRFYETRRYIRDRNKYAVTK